MHASDTEPDEEPEDDEADPDDEPEESDEEPDEEEADPDEEPLLPPPLEELPQPAEPTVTDAAAEPMPTTTSTWKSFLVDFKRCLRRWRERKATTRSHNDKCQFWQTDGAVSY